MLNHGKTQLSPVVPAVSSSINKYFSLVVIDQNKPQAKCGVRKGIVKKKKQSKRRLSFFLNCEPPKWGARSIFFNGVDQKKRGCVSFCAPSTIHYVTLSFLPFFLSFPFPAGIRFIVHRKAQCLIDPTSVRGLPTQQTVRSADHWESLDRRVSMAVSHPDLPALPFAQVLVVAVVAVDSHTACSLAETCLDWTLVTTTAPQPIII